MTPITRYIDILKTSQKYLFTVSLFGCLLQLAFSLVIARILCRCLQLCKSVKTVPQSLTLAIHITSSHFWCFFSDHPRFGDAAMPRGCCKLFCISHSRSAQRTKFLACESEIFASISLILMAHIPGITSVSRHPSCPSRFLEVFSSEEKPLKNGMRRPKTIRPIRLPTSGALL